VSEDEFSLSSSSFSSFFPPSVRIFSRIMFSGIPFFSRYLSSFPFIHQSRCFRFDCLPGLCVKICPVLTPLFLPSYPPPPFKANGRTGLADLLITPGSHVLPAPASGDFIEKEGRRQLFPPLPSPSPSLPFDFLLLG